MSVFALHAGNPCAHPEEALAKKEQRLLESNMTSEQILR
jgi:hypothetical protein